LARTISSRFFLDGDGTGVTSEAEEAEALLLAGRKGARELLSSLESWQAEEDELEWDGVG